MNSDSDWTRRSFFRAMGVTPTLSLLSAAAASDGESVVELPWEQLQEKFTPLDLRSHFNASPSDFGRPKVRLNLPASSDGLIHFPGGRRVLRGIPFHLGDEVHDQKCWLVISGQAGTGSSGSIEVPIGRKSGYICLAQFCDWPEGSEGNTGVEGPREVGEHLADVILIPEGGNQLALPIRRRFEVNTPWISWGHFSFAALPHGQAVPRALTSPLEDATNWGGLQMGFWDEAYQSPILWICSLANPDPDRVLKAIRLRAQGRSRLVVCGLTLYHGTEHPLRYRRLSTYRLALPDASAQDRKRWKIDVDLGVVARTYAHREFDPNEWLSAPAAGMGDPARPPLPSSFLYLEIAASGGATLSVFDTKTGRRYRFNLSGLTQGRELEARPEGSRIDILDHQRVWLHGQVVDSATRRPTPVRIAFRSAQGHYIPPYGHRTEINTGWFQDYGADLKLGESSFAYIDGTFQVELPVGQVLVEISKGFEYEPVRRMLKIEPGQRELNLEMSRWIDLRRRGWVTADTHVHFLSPSTALLEAQAEGVNLIHLMAAQLGDLFSNVGDLAHGSMSSSDGQTVVRMGTENRQHLLGHISLLGGRGEPVFPMSSGGPGTSYFGDPLWSSLSEWATACREREGLAVFPHFPNPPGEIAADIVTGAVDAVELWPRQEGFDGYPFQEWYRYLNCGYRLPAVGGTDKMSAAVPVGANRTYAYLGDQEFSLRNWTEAVRSGNTFSSTGPLLFLKAEGQMPGGEIRLGAGGATIDVYAEARSFCPVHRLEIVLNGQIVAGSEEKNGSRVMTVRDRLRVTGPAWLAARCFSRLGAATAWPFAIASHTSPIYLLVAGRELFSPDVAAYLLKLVEGAQYWVENLATQPDEQCLARIRKVFEDARGRIQKRLHAHGMDH